MAEFQEVMKQWNRMCNSNTCDECEIYKKCLKWVCGGHEGRLVSEEVKAAEIIIMQWAAEHPEPVYPTWEDWLTEQEILVDSKHFYVINKEKIKHPIPADIAQKLGLKPKER